ncbi:MAG TPA: alpha/beta hydrolase-fold protein [Phycisphaerae bacterium]|nr:alpha/beta hydrolase-fold protein [Phycisphaerae bacterium]
MALRVGVVWKVPAVVVAVAVLAVLGPIVRAEAPARDGAGSGAEWKRFYVRSAATGKVERFWVGRPPGLKDDGRYGVVYFLPGLLDTEDHWKRAIAPHLARHQVIAVCPSVGGATWFMNSPAHEWMRWGDFLTEELRAFVESNYPASRAKGERGIVGISAGGQGALYHALCRPDLFGSVSVLSGALYLEGYAGTVGLDWWIGPRTPQALPLYTERSALRLVGAWGKPLPFALSLDTADKDGARSQMEALKRILDAKGFAYEWHLGQGAHNWKYWGERTEAHLAWHADRFAEHRRDNRYMEAAAAPASAPLEVLKGPPDVALSKEALRRLRAPWDGPTDSSALAVSGLSAGGASLEAKDEQHRQLALTAALTARGHEPALYVYRLTFLASTPLTDAGAVTLAGRLRNGAKLHLLTIPKAALPLPGGESKRRVELRARLAVELKEPDPLRGGILAALQVFDADGKPVGDPLVGKARPGTAAIEYWPIAPQAFAEWTLSLSGPGVIGLVAIEDVRLQAEPAAPAPVGP